MEHKGFLLNKTDLRTEVRHIDIADIHVINEDLSVVVVVIAEQEVDKGRFTRTGRTNDTNNIAGLDGEVDILKSLLGTVEGEVYVLEFDLTLELGHILAFTEVVLGLGIKNIKNSFSRCKEVLEGVIKVCKEVYGLVEHRCVGNEGNEKTYGKSTVALDNHSTAECPDNYRTKTDKCTNDCGESIEDLRRICVGLVPLLVLFLEASGGVLFVSKGFYDTDTGDSIGKYG